MCKDLTPIEHFGWYKCLEILGKNKTYILCTLPVQKLFQRHWGADIDRRYKNSAFQKSWNIAHNMCFIILSLPDKNFQPILFVYPFQSSTIVRNVLKQELKLKYA